MSQPLNRRIFQIVLVFAAVAFAGVAFIPIFSAFNHPISLSSSVNGTSSSGLSTSEPTSNLEDQVRGYQLVLQKEPDNQAALKGLLEARLRLLSHKQRGEIKPSDIQGAIEPLEKLTKLNPQQSNYAVLLAQAKEQIGDKEGAAQAYNSILSTKPGDLKALQGMVKLQIDQQRPQAAIGLLQDTLSKAATANSIQPGTIDVIAVKVLLGSVYTFQKNYSQAASVYDQAIKENAQDFRPVLAKAMLVKEQGHNEQAKPLFQNALALAPSKYKDEINRLAELTLPHHTKITVPSPSSTSSPTNTKP